MGIAFSGYMTHFIFLLLLYLFLSLELFGTENTFEVLFFSSCMFWDLLHFSAYFLRFVRYRLSSCTGRMFMSWSLKPTFQCLSLGVFVTSERQKLKLMASSFLLQQIMFSFCLKATLVPETACYSSIFLWEEEHPCEECEMTFKYMANTPCQYIPVIPHAQPL